MKKNDKILIAVGIVVILIVAAGVYTWVPAKGGLQKAEINQLYHVTGEYSQVPSAITVSDESPFYALIATPLAVHYDQAGVQEIVPLYIANFSNPSRAVVRAVDQIQRPVDCVLDNSKSPKQWSIKLAKDYWAQSDAILVIEDNEQGYNLGVLATPIASYLSIPVIVTDSIDSQVQEVFNNLGVKYIILCGEHLGGYGDALKFSTVDDVVNASISLVREKFGEVNYITITNPVDAWPPEVLASEKFVLGPKTMTTRATTMLVKGISKSDNVVGTFVIPDDYKYALVKFTGINLNIDNVDSLGDNVIFACGPASGEIKDAPAGLEKFELYAGGTNAGGVPIRDQQGNVVVDQTYSEAVLYDRGGVKYEVTASPSWLASATGQVKAEVVVEKLSSPIYPMMKDLSTIAPYLTAYHQGIAFGRSWFAFAADDDILYKGNPLPGFSQPKGNPELTGPADDHVFEVHDEINGLLANLADISLDNERDIEQLQNYYKINPVNIALVGDATVLPQMIYDSSIDPIAPLEDVSYYFGGGVPSDFIYGNVDPNPGDWSSQAPDMYSDYPYQENIVGRITGWDAQDASALVARTVFYTDIVNNLGDWKDTAVIQMGGGNDFQKPLVKYKIFGELLNVIKRGEPMKLETGASYFNGLNLQHSVLEKLGFTTGYTRENEAAFQGFSSEAITTLKKANWVNKFFMSPRQISQAVGTDVVVGRGEQESSNFIMANAHGNQHMFGMGDVSMYKLGIGLPRGVLPRLFEQIAAIFGAGPGLSLSDQGYYSTRNVEQMNLGPSFLFIESCICGKIDGLYPTQGISQAYLHSGCNAVIASTTSSNIAGGYLEPKRTKYDLPGQTLYRYLVANKNAKQGVYPDLHFGFKIYADLCSELNKNDATLGLALRNARNRYLPEDAAWKVWWSPPLITTGFQDIDNQIFKSIAEKASSGLNEQLDNKYMSFFEYTLYGDPAFTPYIPGTK